MIKLRYENPSVIGKIARRMATTFDARGALDYRESIFGGFGFSISYN
jgi:hypothetical protein